MGWVIGIGMLVSLALIALGVVSMRTGWVLPWARRHVTRPRVYGFGALLAGVPCVVQGLYYFRLPLLPDLSGDVRFYGTTPLLLCGLLLIGLGQLLPRRQATSPGP